MDSKILTEKQAAAYIGMSMSYLRNSRCMSTYRCQAPGPVYLKLGRAVRYRECDLDAWLNANVITEHCS